MTSATAGPVEARIEAEFDKLDLNRDGYLEWSDYETLIGRYKKAARVGDDDRRIMALRAFYELHWLELRRYADQPEERLSKSQFVAATRASTEDSRRLNVTETGGHVIFDLIDANGDGAISQDELTRYLRDVWQIEGNDDTYNLQALDRDGDSQISREEFVNGIQDHMDA